MSHLISFLKFLKNKSVGNIKQEAEAEYEICSGRKGWRACVENYESLIFQTSCLGQPKIFFNLLL